MTFKRVKRKSKSDRKEGLRTRQTHSIEGKRVVFSDSILDPTKIDLTHNDLEYYRLPAKEESDTPIPRKLDLVPYLVQTDKHSGGLEPGYEDYKYDYRIHYQVGPESKKVVCPSTIGRPCPICVENSKEADETLHNVPKRRSLYNVVDLSDPVNEDGSAKVKIFEVSSWLFDRPLNAALQAAKAFGEIITVADVEEGKTVMFTTTSGSGGGHACVNFDGFRFTDRAETYGESILEKTHPFDAMIKILDYDTIETMYKAISITEEEEVVEVEDKYPDYDDVVDEEEVKPATTTRRKTKRTPKAKTCPCGHEFGVDNGKFPEDCDEEENCGQKQYDKCLDAKDELE